MTKKSKAVHQARRVMPAVEDNITIFARFPGIHYELAYPVKLNPTLTENCVTERLTDECLEIMEFGIATATAWRFGLDSELAMQFATHPPLSAIGLGIGFINLHDGSRLWNDQDVCVVYKRDGIRIKDGEDAARSFIQTYDTYVQEDIWDGSLLSFKFTTSSDAVGSELNIKI